MFGFTQKFHHAPLEASSDVILSRIIAAFGLSIIDTIWSVYLKSFELTNSQIGFLTSFFMFIICLFALKVKK